MTEPLRQNGARHAAEPPRSAASPPPDRAPRLSSARSQFDVAILGGGPAGSAAALSLKQVEPGLRVLLVEAGNYETFRTGETLAPGGQILLQGLGCWPQFQAANFIESLGTEAAWGSPLVHRNEFLLFPRGNAWHLDRSRFDAMLANAAAGTGAELRCQTRFVRATRETGIWTLQLQTKNRELPVAATFLIDATGRNVRLARWQGARIQRHDRLAGVTVVYRSQTEPPANHGSTLVEASAHGWWYSAGLPNKRLLIAWMSDTDLIHAARLRDAGAWDQHLRTSGPTRGRVASATVVGSPQIWPATTQALTQLQGDAWVAAGDAACAWDPLSSAGILKALRTGRLAAFVALDFLKGRPDLAERYSHLVRADHAAYLAGRTWFYGQEKRWQAAPFWRRRHPNHGTAG